MFAVDLYGVPLTSLLCGLHMPSKLKIRLPANKAPVSGGLFAEGRCIFNGKTGSPSQDLG
jgi:hypothetical protein